MPSTRRRGRSYPKGPIESKLAGHFSPIAAYSEKADRFLMLDVARYKYPPVWIPTRALYDAMSTTDVDSGKTRSYLVVHAAKNASAAATAVHPRSRFLIFVIVAALTVFGLGALFGAWLTRRRLRKIKAWKPSHAEASRSRATRRRLEPEPRGGV